MNVEIESTNKVLTPALRWYQNDEYIFITFEVVKCKDNGIKFIDNTSFSFNVMSDNNIQYFMEIQMYKNYVVDESNFNINEKTVKVIFRKENNENWERLTLQKNAYKNNIKVDWDNWVNEVSDEEDNNKNNNERNMEGMGNQQFDFKKMMESMGGIQNMQDMMGGMNINDFVQNEDSGDNDYTIENDDSLEETCEDEYCQDCNSD